jgi:galactose mutarotase-like enzyme
LSDGGQKSGTVELGVGRLGLTVDLAFGARVLTLTDRNTGRQWLMQGGRASDTSDDAAYLGDASRGWDECFPTVLPCHHAAWGGRVRDHGLLWGRPWEAAAADNHQLEARFRGYGIVFTRTLTADGATADAAYTLSSERDVAVPYLWSQHCVLSLAPEDRIALSGQGQVHAAGRAFDWPVYPNRDLSRVGTPDEGFSLKAYAPTPGPASAEVWGPGGGLRFDWSGPEIPAVGVWLDYGAWPAGAPVHQVALEPTTGEADDLVGAAAIGQARWLEPGETHHWSVRLTVTDLDRGGEA